jgi:putative protease
MYKNLGFKRIVLGREVSLDEIKRIKDSVPDMELEAFCHGAMCIAYAGRCLMSAYLTGRSAQSGFCSHTCRWEYDVLSKPNGAKELAESGRLFLREHQRPDELFPVYEGEDFTAVLSSKDLCMINHLQDMKDAGIDSLKIEGRMKSIYYVALVTRAYRKALDALEGKITQEEAAPFIAELENVSHRESTTGFFYNKAEADKTAIGASDSKYLLAAEVGQEITGEEFDAIYNAGQKSFNDFSQKLEALHPAAKEARLKDIAEHPDRNVVPFEKKRRLEFIQMCCVEQN